MSLFIYGFVIPHFVKLPISGIQELPRGRSVQDTTCQDTPPQTLAKVRWLIRPPCLTTPFLLYYTTLQNCLERWWWHSLSDSKLKAWVCVATGEAKKAHATEKLTGLRQTRKLEWQWAGQAALLGSQHSATCDSNCLQEAERFPKAVFWSGGGRQET